MAQTNITSSLDIKTNPRINTFYYAKTSKIITDYSTDNDPSWNFCHDGNNIMAMPWFSGSTTYTPHKVVECKSFDGVTNEIKKLNLKLTEEQQEELNKLIEQYATPTNKVDKIDIKK